MAAQSVSISQRGPPRWSLLSAAILSLTVPGFGQIYVGRRGRGLVFVALYLLARFVIWLSSAGIFPRFFILAPAVAALLCVYVVSLVDSIAAATNSRASAPRAFIRWSLCAGIGFALLVAMTAISGAAASILPGSGYYRIPSASMAPTLRPGESLLADVLYFQRHEPRRGDVVVFKRPERPGALSIMRVIAIAGDRVSVVDGHAVVNGKVLNETYADPGDPAVFTNTTGEWVVPQGAVFVLGDNRANSVDSRLYGSLPIGSLIGRATDIVLSHQFDRVGKWVGTPGDHAL